ncbi:hypothetical protein EDF57_1137 [Novosphingobium sp. PhB55]|nr:hypothetical protein EDF57_1137 [Novosphingobium sp. PhB55]
MPKQQAAIPSKRHCLCLPGETANPRPERIRGIVPVGVDDRGADKGAGKVAVAGTVLKRIVGPKQYDSSGNGRVARIEHLAETPMSVESQ